MDEQEAKMTLRTGNRTNAKPFRAFTLIELILVMAMLLIVLAVAAPSLSNFFKGRSLDSEARRFLSVTRYGQSRAVSEAIPMILWIDAQEGAYGLEQEASYNNADGKAIDYDLGKDLQIEVRDLPNQATVQVGLANRNPNSIRFRPDGFIAETSPKTVVIKDASGDAVWISQSRNGLTYEIQTNALQSVSR
jgi:type II secretion system protein H